MMRLVFIALAFLSGCVALTHELLWTRRLIDLLGASDWVTGRVLGLFFLGLSIGGWIAARWTEKKINVAGRLGIVEFAIALLSVPAIFLPFWADGIIAAIGPEALVATPGKLLKLFLSGLVVLPPAIAMGTTMPLFIRVATIVGGTVKGAGICIYSVNMLGGVVGLWLASTQLLDQFGVQGTMVVTASGNCLIGISALLLSRFVVQADAKTENETRPQENQSQITIGWSPGRNGVFVLAFLSGAFVLALEVLVLRLMSLVAPSSFHTTSALLANVILFLSLGAFGVALLNRLRISSMAQLIMGFTGAAAFCALCPIILYHQTDQLISIRYILALHGQTIGSLSQYWVLLLGIIATAAGATLFCSGLVFPSILSLNAKTDPAGKSVGRLLAINGLGGLLGCELANWFLLSQTGIFGGFVVLAVVIFIAALVVCCLGRFSAAAIGLAVAGLAFTALTYQQYDQLRYLSPRSKTKYVIEETKFGPEGVLMVARDPSGSRSMLLNNQYVLGSSGVAEVERRQLLLPWLLHPNANDVCCLGLATGISASGLELLQDPPNVTAVELSAMVAKLARESFAKENLNFAERRAERQAERQAERRVNRIVKEDGRTFLAATSDRYDLIVADLFRPHGAGEGRLFSIEHYRNVKRALKDDGMFCQWLPAHQLREDHFQIIAATFQKEFPNTLVIVGGSLSKTPSIGLCAWKTGRAWEANELTQNLQSVHNEKGISDKLVLNAHLLIVGALKKEAFADAPVNTLDNALLELSAGRFWILKDLRPKRPQDNLENGFLSGANWRRFLRKLHRDAEPVLDPNFREQFLQLLN